MPPAKPSPLAAVAQNDDFVAQIEAANDAVARARTHMAELVFGQPHVVDHAIITLLAGGHALVIGLPGLAKTRLARSLGTVFGLVDKRIQFTPDLMPSDIVGSEVLEEAEGGQRAFRFIEGPVFCQLLLADEINRASPRTQSALLQAMQENEVTVAGRAHPLPAPFHVLSTQNPIEQEGTYPLPEAQLDRFLMRIDIGYPDRDSERTMLIATTGPKETEPEQIISAQELLDMQALVRSIPVGDSVVEAILTLVRRGRPDLSEIEMVREHVSWGPGPRASQALMLSARARAVLDGRLAPSVDDVVALARPVLRHRMDVTFAARADGLSVLDVIDRLTESIA